MFKHKDILLAIQQNGAARYPEEACGLVVRVGNKSVAVSCKNTAEYPNLHFVIDHNDYIRASDMGEVIGVWHTHVHGSSQPSEADRIGCEAIKLPWYIVGVTKTDDGFVYDEMFVLEPNGFELDYIGRPYAFGVIDCWSLVRDYYRREYNIILGDYPRIERFWANGFDFFGENWQNEGFVKLIDEEPKGGDLFLIQTDASGNPNHIAIYLGDETILHHCHGRLSKRDVYGGYWLKHTTHHLRHKTKC